MIHVNVRAEIFYMLCTGHIDTIILSALIRRKKEMKFDSLDCLRFLTVKMIEFNNVNIKVLKLPIRK